jgi:hypothetical protein
MPYTKNGNFAYANGFQSRQKALTFRLQTLLIVGDYPIRQLILHTRILVGWFSWELNPEDLGSFWLKASATWGGGITSAERLRDGKASRAPFLIMPWHSPYN